MKKAIIVTSFGTTHQDTREKTIDVLCADIKQNYPEYEVRQVFTSKIVRQRILENEGKTIHNLGDELERLVSEGYQEIVIQSTHIIPGSEFHKIYMFMKRVKKENITIKVGKPLLTSLEDYEEMVEYLTSAFTPESAHEITLFMAHGTEHASFTSYVTLAYMLSGSSIYMACVESYPHLSTLLPQLKAANVEKVNLRPFMLVAGDHAKNDMASDEEDSWKTQLIQAGFEVETHVQGLGEFKPVRERYLAHLEEAIQTERRCKHAR